MHGKIILKDGTQKNGQIKWFPDQNEKLKFRENENGATQKFSPEELSGFIVDTFSYISLFNFEVFAEEYALLGKLTKIKHSFGQLLDSGSFNIYFVMLSGYNALSGSIQSYPNFLFEKKSDSINQYAAFPYAMRMKPLQRIHIRYRLFIPVKGIVNKCQPSTITSSLSPGKEYN